MAENRRADRARLSKDVVVRQALKLADADGLDALTIRRLATDLGVTPMALYWHFRSKDELLLGIADQLWSEIDIGVDPDARWLDQLRALLRSLLTTLRAHPSGSTLLMAGKTRLVPGALRVIEVSLEVLALAGFSPQDATQIARSGLRNCLTLVAFEPGGESTLTVGESAEQQRRQRIELEMLPADRYRRVVAAAGPLSGCDDVEAYYDFGTELFLGGVEAIAARRT